MLPLLLLLLAFALACFRPRRRPGRWRRRAPPPAGLTTAVIRPVHRRAKPAWVTQEVIRLKAHLPRAGCRQLADTFNHLHAARCVSVGNTWVSDVLKTHHYAIRRPLGAQCLTKWPTA